MLFATRSLARITICLCTLLAMGMLLGGCASTQVVERSREMLAPRLADAYARMPDGYRLPLRFWPGKPRKTTNRKIVALGLHGFNDYSEAFAPLAMSLAGAGIATYAVDQRGFGATDLPGRWHGSAQLSADLAELSRLLRHRHPNARLYLIGESMGGAVAIDALAKDALPVDGAVLIAPAVWSRNAMPWYQRLALDTLANIAPGMKLTGEGVSIRPSDNIDMLRAMGADPLVIKAPRVDALWGVTNLMDHAMDASNALRGPLLILYGERDEIIPRGAFCRMLDRLPGNVRDIRLVLYGDGWHMLPRDLQSRRVHADLIAWLHDPRAQLPSGEESTPKSERTRNFCSSPSTMAR
ncbi:MAG: lysophospholipase [Thiohalocapsa sp.]